MDVKTLCLGVLTFGDATGYEIKGYFEDGPFSHFFQAGYGSIYPALSKALGENYVVCRSESQDGRPDKKIYSLTAEGKAYLTGELNGEQAGDKIRSEFLVAMFFAKFIEAQTVEKIFDHYLAECDRNLEVMKSLDGGKVPAGQLLVRKFGLHLYGSIGDFLRGNREKFLDDIKAENASTNNSIGRSPVTGTATEGGSL